MKKNYYTILDIPTDASAEQIKKAYKKKALKYHPDRNKNDKEAEEKFKEAAQAYEILGDPKKRKVYDKYGEDGLKNSGFQAHHVNVEDILRDFGNMFNFGTGQFKDFFSSQRQTPSAQDLNIYLKIKINLEESVKGTTKKIKLNRYMTCPYCHGNGAKDGTALKLCDTCRGSGQEHAVQSNLFMQVFSSKACQQCQGEGKIIYQQCLECKGQGRQKIEEIVNINIPPGVTQGMQLTKTGKGHAPMRGGVPGDLVILIEEIEDELLKRDNLNIHYTCFISFADAIHGIQVEVPTIEGPLKINIPKHTQSGETIVLKGKGLPNVNYPRTKGDQIIHIYVWTPKKLSQEAKKALEELQKLPDFTPPKKPIDPTFFDKNK